jgi:hypothetical protein
MIIYAACATIMQQCYCMIPNGHIRWSLNIAFGLPEFVAAKSFARLAVERCKWPLEKFSLSGIIGVDRVIS